MVWAGPSQAHFFQPAIVVEELPCLDAQGLRHRVAQHLGGMPKCIQGGLSWPCWHQRPPGTASGPNVTGTSEQIDMRWILE
jgi:hypothetical protein